ncbi:MAG: Biotin transporter BioY [Alphaproteobacteria bacterium MarineAlpha5_Bin8]|nr:MAG: Biotin transporter BioY [Alphaproteobacteria bacterium MarineAlpha5_Bin7]PPR47172.1 MAG: Biotin transporter BioY [Alphaproteobacteria bacterium MarineAlpha5_Bin8]PPR54194.1 MAG: Biotin transporter BioY [Alphaproteobacteria bacterium MarineAlpha5_Bin6]|tara:strand:+ start:10064 stop:10630 length:567 start_codon:yes stop_codon:yes gene_type:complete
MKNSSVLINSIYPADSGIKYILKLIILSAFGSLLLALSSKIQVPFWPVPMTMQTFMVFIIGMTYGFTFSSYTLVSYLMLGAIGLPVFAKGGGILYLTGPTAGYLYGMAIAAAVIGFLADRGYAKSYLKSLIAIFIGTVIIFALGVGYLGSVIGYDKALAGGLYPFLLSEAFKIALAISIVPTISKLTK